MSYGDIGTLEDFTNDDTDTDTDTKTVNMKDFDASQYSIDYDTIFQCYNYAMTIAQRNNLSLEDFKDEFYDALLNKGAPDNEAFEISEYFNPT